MKKLYIIALLAINTAFCLSAIETKESTPKKTISKKELALLNEQLLSAVERNDIEAIPLLFDAGADVNAVDKNYRTSLHIAADNSYKDIIELLIENKANISAVDKNGWAPLHLTVNKGNTDNTKLLIDADADVHAKASYSWTPLHLAAGNDNTEIIKLLINANADVLAVDNGGNTPMYRAAEKGNIDILLQLLTETATPQEYTARIYSKNQKNEKVSELKKLASINIFNNFEFYDSENLKQNLYHIIPNIDAIKEERLQSMKSLLETPNKKNKTALDIAKDKKYEKISQIMKSIIDAQNFQELPEEIRLKTENSIIRVFLTRDEKFAS